MKDPSVQTQPMQLEIIREIGSTKILTTQDYYSTVSSLRPNTSVTIKTNKGLYKLDVGTNSLGLPDLGLRIAQAPKSNLREGLDLQGGTRVLLQPERKLSTEEMDVLISNMKERLNVFGLSDVIIRPAGDLSGNQYVLIEIAGVNEEEVKELIAKQGKFEAKIANDSVFKGGADIRQVCRTAECSGIDTSNGCGQVSDGSWACRFTFAITLSPEAAQRQADLTKDLTVVSNGNGQDYLSLPLDLYLDDQSVDSLQIGKELKGKAVTDIAISGPGFGASEQEAQYNTLQNMRRLQTILVTGSLPVKLNIVKTDNISPVLGSGFLKSTIIMLIVAIIAVAIVLIVPYRKISLAVPVLVTMVSEVVILLGVASLIRWNIDLVAIAGIIVAIGTGVDDQIIITDEALMKESQGTTYNWKQRIANAFFIIMACYFSLMVAMAPLYFAGAGLLRGFALTTMLGVSIGVFITRPVYAAIVEILVREDE
jgi:preprotein translocase subunit SecD